ncbi:MAG: hypothetical protein VKL39_17625 [Leptolyngbyaceae bacterium]|nr:hypothetical protein [Leptolyngbyaceae bacterium]
MNHSAISITSHTSYPAQTPVISNSVGFRANYLWMGSCGLLLAALVAMWVVFNKKLKTLEKEKHFEEFKNRELKKKLKLALETITKMERNPDLIYSREFNLDYLRMRMEEKQFHFIIMNQIKIKVKDKVSMALRMSQASPGIVGVASAGRKIDEIFDVEHQLSERTGSKRGVLFRIQFKLTKLPAQATTAIVQEIVDCLEAYMSPTTDHDTWQPTIQGRIASISWDQKAKPTPLLVLAQSNEGVNVTFRTNRMVRK